MDSETYSALDKLDFGSLLGSPLKSCIDAQAQAASATADYIQRVGFEYDPEQKLYKTRTLTFQYSTPEGEKKIIVPLISVVPVPFLQINNVDLDFTADVSVSDGQLMGRVSAKNDTYNAEDNQSTDYTNDLQVRVNIKAASADIPMGVSKLLQIMQENIRISDYDVIDETVDDTEL